MDQPAPRSGEDVLSCRPAVAFEGGAPPSPRLLEDKKGRVVLLLSQHSDELKPY
jgi:hypothetical protein